MPGRFLAHAGRRIVGLAESDCLLEKKRASMHTPAVTRMHWNRRGVGEVHLDLFLFDLI